MTDLLRTLAAVGFLAALWAIAPWVNRRNQRRPRDYSHDRGEGL